MKRKLSGQSPWQGRIAPAIALCALLGIAVYAMVGPTGLLAWIDYRAALAERRAELATLNEARGALRNRVDLLHPDHVDADLAGELIRRELNVAAPDEIVVPLD